MPVVEFKSNAKPSTYGYPAPLEEKKKEDKEKVNIFFCWNFMIIGL